MSILTLWEVGKPGDRSLNDLPAAIKEKVYFIGHLIDEVTSVLVVEKDFPYKITIESFLNSQEGQEQDELRQILNELFTQTLRPSEETPDFDTELRQTEDRGVLMAKIIAIVNEESPNCAQRILTEIGVFNVEEEVEEENDSAILRFVRTQSMSDPNYKPALEIYDLKQSLIDLLLYWLIWPSEQVIFLQESVEAKTGELKLVPNIKEIEANLDLSLAKIAYQLGKKVASICCYGRRERNRGVSSGLGKKAQNAPPIIEAFRGLNFPKEIFPHGRVSLRKVASMIQESLKLKNPAQPPDLKTITNYLKADENIWKLFKEEQSGMRKSIFMEIDRQ